MEVSDPAPPPAEDPAPVPVPITGSPPPAPYPPDFPITPGGGTPATGTDAVPLQYNPKDRLENLLEMAEKHEKTESSVPSDDPVIDLSDLFEEQADETLPPADDIIDKDDENMPDADEGKNKRKYGDYDTGGGKPVQVMLSNRPETRQYLEHYENNEATSQELNDYFIDSFALDAGGTVSVEELSEFSTFVEVNRGRSFTRQEEAALHSLARQHLRSDMN